MIPWIRNKQGIFNDIHETLRSYSFVVEFLKEVEKEKTILEYCKGDNTTERLLFQIFNKEFIGSISSILESIQGPIVEVMAGDGKLTEFLKLENNIDIIATDSRDYWYDIAYPKWVREYDAMEALVKLRPSMVILSWEPLYSDVGYKIVRGGYPLIWIGDPERCAPSSGVLDETHIKMNSEYAIGRYDSINNKAFNTDIYLFNIDMEE